MRQKYFTALFISLFILFPLLLFSNQDRATQVQILNTINNNEQHLKILNERVRYMQDTFSELNKEINSLKQSLAIERQNNATLKRDIDTLRKQMETDKIQTQKTLDSAINKLAQETAKTVNDAMKTAQRTSPQQTPAVSSTSSQTSAKFYRHTVEQGATLSTIARAYNVSVDSIKKANTLKNDNIFVGQILLIPKVD